MKLLNKYFAWIGLSALLVWGACDEYEDYPIEQFTIDYVFSTTDSLGRNARQYLNTIYGIMSNGHNRVGGDYLDAASDDAISSALNESDVQRLAVGRYTSASTVGSDMDWGTYYTGIRKANTFINHIDVVPLMNTFNDSIPLNRAWKAEARFLKAYFYFELVKRYGGVPLVGDTPFELGENIELPRNTFEDCINYIAGELDAIKDSLRTVPIMNASDDGHVVTQGAALALKSRVLLYAASPLFNERPIEASNPRIGYTSYDHERWKKAADAARFILDSLPKSQYALNARFANIFGSDYGTSNKEIIFFRQGGMGTSIEVNNGPVGFTGTNIGNGRTSPTQNLVDAFPMLDGKDIHDPDSKYTYTLSTMYSNRDPRLELTVLHNGSRWLNALLETFEGGIHNPAGTMQKTKTSYYLRKFMAGFETQSNYSSVLHNWIMFRYGEIMLNYAEAQNEYAGPSDEVYQVIKDLRKRAGIEVGSDRMYGLKTAMSKEEMRTVIRNERRIEMAFEEQRYWDIRRWRLAEDIFKEPLNGLLIIKNSAVLSYSVVPVLSTTFEPKRYFYPIPYSEVIKNRNMVQNPGW